MNGGGWSPQRPGGPATTPPIALMLVTAAVVAIFLFIYAPRVGAGFIADDFEWASRNRVRSAAARDSAKDQKVSGTVRSFKRMADGKRWTTENLNLGAGSSYCYADTDLNCRRYGRLYTWESAQRGCQSVGDGWRLPTDDEWRQLAKQYGGVGDSDDGGKGAYKALLVDGRSGFNALLGGGRSEDGQYARLEAHGFYWTATESDPARAFFYNFARGALSLFRQNQGEKQRAFSVRCVSE